MGNKTGSILLATFLALASTGTSSADDDNRGRPGRIKAKLVAFQEVPAISSKATGEFTATLSDDKIEYTLSWSNLEGGPATQAHIHVGQHSVNGGISTFLCSNLGNGPAGTQACPGTPSGEIKGTIVPANIIGPTSQGVAAGEFAELLRAIRAGKAYANVHNATWPGGEIRAQLSPRGQSLRVLQDLLHEHDDDDDEDDD